MSANDDLVAGYSASYFGKVHYRRYDVQEPIASLGLFEPSIAIGHPINIAFSCQSSPPVGPVSMRDIAEAVAAYLTSLDMPRAHVCGLHTGAKMATALALD